MRHCEAGAPTLHVPWAYNGWNREFSIQPHLVWQSCNFKVLCRNCRRKITASRVQYSREMSGSLSSLAFGCPPKGQEGSSGLLNWLIPLLGVLSMVMKMCLGLPSAHSQMQSSLQSVEQTLKDCPHNPFKFLGPQGTPDETSLWIRGSLDIVSSLCFDTLCGI